MQTLELAGLSFAFVERLAPERDAEDAIRRLRPHERYEGRGTATLVDCGEGPFCRFRISSDIGGEGVYALTIDSAVTYIGECIDLRSRWNAGYGNISPRNCYVGGQPTNCRINHGILRAAEEDRILELWFHVTSDRKRLEAHLLKTISPPWNRRGGGL